MVAIHFPLVVAPLEQASYRVFTIHMLYTSKFFVLALANLSILASFGAFFLFPLFIVEKGGDQTDIGILMGAFALASVICRPWISEMVDSIGRKRSYTIGCLIMTILPLCHLFIPGDIMASYVPLLAVRIVHGVGFAICITAAFTFVADMIPAGRLNEGIGIFGVSGLMGSAVGPALAESGIERFGFDALFFGASALAAVALLAHLPISDPYRMASAGRHNDFFRAARRKGVLPVAFLSILFGFGLAASNNFVSPFAAVRNTGFVSTYYIALSGAAVITRVLGCRLMDRVGETRLVPLAFAAAGGGLMSLMALSGPVTLALGGFLTGFGLGFLYPSLSALALRDEPADMRGKVTGVFTGSVDAGCFVGAVILGVVGERAGFESLFLLAGGVFLVALALFQMAVRRSWLKAMVLPAPPA